MTKQDKKVLNTISQAIFDKKGFNILVLDIRGLSTMTDYYIIAEGSVDRHVKALSSAVKDVLGEVNLKAYHTEGEREADWIVMDCGEVVIHLFTPDLREKYALEDVWKKGKIVDVDITVHENASKKGL